MRKQQKYRAKIRKGIAVGSALLLGASAGQSAGGRVNATPTGTDLGILPIAPPIAPIDTTRIAATPQTVIVSMAPDASTWSKSDMRRFRELASRRASGEATAEEQAEFYRLQQRRRLHHLASAEELMVEWRRRRFVGEILDVLQRNVSFFQAEDQARLRSFRKA